MSATEAPKRYRWLTVGERYTYVARPGKGRDDLRKRVCTVLIVPRAGAKPGNALVMFDDGDKAIVPAGVLRKVQP